MSERETLKSALLGCACLAAVVVAAVLLAGCDARVTDEPSNAEPVPGPTGPRGPRGIPGPACEPVALETYQATGHDATLGAVGPRFAHAWCDGDVVLGGGCSLEGDIDAATVQLASRPIDDGDAGWQCVVDNGGRDLTVHAYAICLVNQ